MNKELEGLINDLRKAQKIIWKVDAILENKGIDSMLRYCEDYTSIAIKEIQKLADMGE